MARDLKKQRAAQAKWARDNPVAYDDPNRVARRTKIREAVDALKRNPCSDCGGTFPEVCMDFDHREGTVKKYPVSKMMATGYALRTILMEVEKCDLVCANCHRIRTFHEREYGNQYKRTTPSMLL